MRTLSAMINNARYLLRTKWVWRAPKKVPVLIYDLCGAELFLHYLNHNDVEVLHVRGESINIYIVLRTLYKKYLLKSSLASKELYKNIYIETVRAKVVLTYIDNRIPFYNLKSERGDFTTVFVQNGYRSEVGDVFDVLISTPPKQSYYVDYMCVFGSAIGELYSAYIQGELIQIGSFKNNMARVSSNEPKYSIVFISQYEPPPADASSFVRREKEKAISWSDFYTAETIVLSFLRSYGKRHGLKIHVCGRKDNEAEEERAYFAGLLGDADWQFIYRNGPFSSYDVMDSAQCIVFIDSTLGYEALARGRKVAAFSLRGETTHSEDANFGWPATLQDNGPFWTNHADEIQMERVMNYVRTVTDEEWLKICQQYASNIIQFDPENTQFLSLMKKLNVSLNHEQCKDIS